MNEQELEEAALISPLVTHFRPDLSREEQIEMTTRMRPYFRALYDVYCRMDREGLLDGNKEE